MLLLTFTTFQQPGVHHLIPVFTIYKTILFPIHIPARFCTFNRMHRQHSFFLLFVLFIHSFVTAQNHAGELIFQHISEKNGLSNNFVNSIARDRNGFMWIATFDGLNRFDGTHFTIFRNNRNQSNTINNNTVHGICVDLNNNIWCATQTGISCFRQQSQDFEVFFPDTIHTSNAYTDIVCDAWGTIWCSANTGLYEYLPQTKTFRKYNSRGPAGQQLSSDILTKRGLVLSPDKRSLWMAGVKGINHFDISAKHIYNYKFNPKHLAVFDSSLVFPVTFDQNGNLLFGKASTVTLFQYDTRSGSLAELDILYVNKIKSNGYPGYIFVDKNNRYWISTWGYSSILYDPLTKQRQEFYNEKDFPFSVSGDFFWHAFQDDEGTIWFGTVNGLSYTNPDQSVYRLYRPLKDAGADVLTGFINCYAEDDKGNWWFTRNNRYAINQYNPSTGALQNVKLGEKYIEIKGITLFKNYLLLNTNSGLLSFNTTTWLIDNLSPINRLQKIVGTQPVYWIRSAGDSILLVLTEQSGIIQYHLRTGELSSVSTTGNDFLKRNIQNSAGSMLSAHGQKIYMAFSPLKMAVYDVTKNQLDSLPVIIDKRVKLSGPVVINLTEDAGGNIWITLGETGLIRYDPVKKETKLWQQSDGLAFNHVFESVFDRQKKLWTAAGNKFSVFTPVKNRFENFSLPVGENNPAYISRLINLRNGNILGNIEKTFVEWLPEKMDSNTTRQPVLINRLVVNDSSVWRNGNDMVRLSHREKNFTIEFGVITGLEKNRYQLQYMLEGFDEKWKTAGPDNAAVYTNVPEKEMVFKVRVVSPDNTRVGKETTLRITVVPPFYRTLWFRVVLALLFATTIVWLIRLRIRSIRKSESQKNEFNKLINEWRLKALRSQMNPHFIFNCMNSIDMYILKNDAENASRYLNKFAKLVRLILSQSAEMYVPLRKEIEMLQYYIDLEVLRFDEPFSGAILVDKNIDPDETEIPSMLLQPYVENAIWHGLRHKKGKGELIIRVSRNDSNLYCVIEDNGIGRAQSAAINASRVNKHESRGTILAEERLKVMDPEKDKPAITIIDLADEQGRACGTRVEISIPVEFDY